jgi:spore germination cell wall hydrolase CwlJ-like protein
LFNECTFIFLSVTPLIETKKSPVYTESEIGLMALNAYREARNQGTTGRLLTVQVVLNRSKFCHCSIKKVIYAPGQFSWVGVNMIPPVQKDMVKFKLEIREYLDGKLKIPIQFENAFAFHNKTIKPMWIYNMRALGKYKGHYFYARK